MREALVFGGSGQIGRPVLAALVTAGWRVTAVSRDERVGSVGLRWLRGGFGDLPRLPVRCDALISCGPLDVFAHWYAGSGIDAARVVVFGSTSVATKLSSADAHERDVAERLRMGEARLFESALRKGAAATVLRPTLVYGAGRDVTLTRIAQLARRRGAFPLPRGAIGRRQPVHVDDLAAAAIACLDAPASHGRAYALPGGETLPYREMVARVLATLDHRPRLIELPAPLFDAALAFARATGRARGLGDAAVKRMRDDLVFDAEPARRDFGYAPRGFQPTGEMFKAA